MFKKLMLASLLLTSTGLVGTANAQGGFLLGMVLGSQMSSSTASGSPSATVLYTAPDETLKGVEPLSIRQVVSEGCFVKGEYSYDKAGWSLAQLFASAVENIQPIKQRTILQIVRVFNGEHPACAAIWFSFIEK